MSRPPASAGPLDPFLLSVVACPRPHHTPLLADDPAAPTSLRCPTCGAVFPVSDGIPVLLEEDALLEEAPGAGAGDG